MPQEASWSGTPSVKGSTETMRMALLTYSMIGLSFTWGIELSYCTPYLLSLGLTKSRTSAVWIAGPLSGIIMQPLVGMITDNSKSKWGRRRPYMIGGSILVAICLFVLGWTTEIMGLFLKSPDTRSFWTIFVAVADIYVLDFAINAVQSCCRSLIVDTLPISKQQLGSAWASRMGSVGHLIGYAIGTLDLRAIWGNWLGDTQFKQLCAIGAFALISSTGLTSWATKERILVSRKDSDKSSGPLTVLVKIFKTAIHLPNRIQAICWVQFWAWIAWFPFLFYSPTWVGETYFRYTDPSAINTSNDKLGEIGRIGSLSLVIFSIITFVATVVLPFIIRSPERANEKFTPRPPPALAATLTFIHNHKPELLTAWFASHLLFAAAMLMAPFVRSLPLATAVVSASGIPWALAIWAPFAFMGVEINRLTAPSTVLSNGAAYRPVEGDDQSSPPSSPTVLRLNHNLLHRTDDDDDDADSGEGGSTGETAGVYLGILNFYTSAPQFAGTFISMIVFAIVEPGKSRELAGEEGEAEGAPVPMGGVNAISVCMFIGGLSSLGAAYAAWRLKYVR